MSAPYQPTCVSSVCVSGSSANWPNEPGGAGDAEHHAALLGRERATEHAVDHAERDAGEARGRSARRRTAGTATVRPGAPSAAGRARTAARRPRPRAPRRSLSAIMPANGWPRPHTRFCTAKASANVSRLQCRSRVIGYRNSPKPWRMPSPSVRIRPPQIEHGGRRAPVGATRRWHGRSWSWWGALGCSCSRSRSASTSSSSLSAPTRRATSSCTRCQCGSATAQLAAAGGAEGDLPGARVAAAHRSRPARARSADRGCATARCGRGARARRGR